MARGEGRSNICAAAVRLFNERGYDNVSLRQIAAEAGTTIGNLTYHFAHKEDLLSAILADLHAGFAERLDRSLSGAELVTRLFELVLENEENQQRLPFYFDNLSQLMAQFPSLREENDTFVAELYGYYAWALASLADDGWIETRDELPQTVAYVLIDMQSSWCQAASPFRNALIAPLPLSRAVAVLLRGHVSDVWRDRYDEVCRVAGIELARLP